MSDLQVFGGERHFQWKQEQNPSIRHSTRPSLHDLMFNVRYFRYLKIIFKKMANIEPQVIKAAHRPTNADTL